MIGNMPEIHVTWDFETSINCLVVSFDPKTYDKEQDYLDFLLSKIKTDKLTYLWFLIVYETSLQVRLEWVCEIIGNMKFPFCHFLQIHIHFWFICPEFKIDIISKFSEVSISKYFTLSHTLSQHKKFTNGILANSFCTFIQVKHVGISINLYKKSFFYTRL